MAGLIKREVVDAVRQRARIDEIVAEHVTLKPAGIGALKGLCPFHDEKSPSFNVRPQLGRWHCFGCGEGGDVISFVQRIDAMGFADAVEYLAGRYGVTVEYESGGTERRGIEPGTRSRLLDANRVAEQYFAEHLSTPEAKAGRRFLAERSFDKSAAELFGVGYAPNGWDNLLRHLRSRGFTEAELTASGLVSQGQRGIYDRFRGRLIWPIRDVTGEVIGFGARKLFEEDPGPKYLNTPETPLYKKSTVLYGIDLARRPIAKQRKIVVVEGYTDVMAAHLSGVDFAVATCGTAFGADHARVVRRMMGDTTSGAGVRLADGGSMGGEVIFTFDGDAAGRKAALRAFAEDEKFFAQTFVAMTPDGMDPCELRMERGPGAVQDLVTHRKPLFEFVISSIVAEHDLDTAEGRTAAVREVAPVLEHIRDAALLPQYERNLAGLVGMPVPEVVEIVGQRRRSAGRRHKAGSVAAQQPHRRAASDPIARLEYDVLAAVLQHPDLAPAETYDAIDLDTFTVPSARAVHAAILSVGGVSSAGGDVAHWLEMVTDEAPEAIRPLISQMAAAPLPQDREDGLPDYVHGLVVKLVDVVLTRRIAEQRGRLGRLSGPGSAEFDAAMESLFALENHRRALRDQN
ncbi:DNA primase [Rarobacter incanus]|uniref:DNA primase n=1 Tax=Rarobacter incanus TaxID=153494 RepID=A0A542SMS0_9MICO|nr:DNA primase [Rarobacter incanus]TQK75926.1 DNA primase [Rarobacter incanus]